MKNNLFCRKGVIILLFSFVQFMTFAQTINVTGKVTDQKGDPIPGVNIVIEGTSNGTITNFEGIYQLQILSNANVIINYRVR